MPFQLTGDGSRGEARKRALAHALTAGAEKKTQDMDGGSSPVTKSAGQAWTLPSDQFQRQGPRGDFHADSMDPKNKGYFSGVLNGLRNFQDFMNPPQPPIA